jgi:hypothetical protein
MTAAAARAAKKEAFEESGLVKISYRVELQNGETWATTALLENEQEWVKMAAAYYGSPDAGYNGRYLTIPKGIRVVSLRLDSIPGLGG